VAALSITNTASNFSDNNHFVDFQVSLPVVKSSDPWAGQHIGIQVLSTVDPSLQGGYWDVDNVRLFAISRTCPGQSCMDGGPISVYGCEANRALTIEILSAGDLSLPLGKWDSLGS